ncbi:hypothetical protein JCM11491_005677 [Sporobolomyces phaffii]
MSGFIDYSTRTATATALDSTRDEVDATRDQTLDAPGSDDEGTRTTGVPRLGKAMSGTVHREEHPDEAENALEKQSQESPRTNALGFIDYSASRGTNGSSLTRTASTGSRFTEEFNDDHDHDHDDHERPTTTRVANAGSAPAPAPARQSKTAATGGGTLFRRRTSKSSTRRPPPPALDRVVSTTSTTHSQDSLQSASSRRIPSFAAAASARDSPPPSSTSSPPQSPTLPASPKSVHSSSGAKGTSGRTRSPHLGPSRSLASHGGSIELSPQDRHYICRILTNSQFQREFSALSQIGTLSRYGDPFLPHPNGPNSKPAGLRDQEARGWFSFLSAGVDKDREREWAGFEWDDENVVDSPVCRYLYWRFIANMPALRTAKPSYWTDQIQPFFDSFAERDLSSTKERGEITKRRMLATGITRIIGSYVSTSIRPTGVSAPARPSLATMNQVDLLVPGNMDSMWKLLHSREPEPDYNAWVAVVEERTQNESTVFRIVSRVLVATDKPLFHAFRSWAALQRFASSLTSLDRRNPLKLPLLPYAASSTPASRASVQTYLRHVVIALSSPPSALQDSEILAEARQLLESFLLAGKDHVSKSELAEWAKRGEERDRTDEQRHRTWVAIGRRVKSLRTIWIKYRKALIEGDELDKTMRLVRKNSLLKMFPKEYRDAEEWAKIWVAYALHYIFVGSSNGAEVLNILKGFHDLIPYAAIKVGLALVNPTLAIRAIVQLVLGQPAGQQSLFQRIWSIIVGTAIKHQKKLIEAYKKKLSRASIGDVLERHVRAPYVERQKTKQVAIETDEDIVLTIMRERGSGSDIELVDRWHEEFRAAAKSGRASGTTKFEDVKNLLAAYYRLRDREQVLAIALEPNTPRLLHASIAVFYDTIYKVANASKLTERVGDIQAFLDDLIRVCLSDKKEPSDFIKLADRHHEKLYYFVHELGANGGTLLDPLLEWCKSGLEFIHTGIPPSSEASSPYKRVGVDVEALLHSLPSSSASSSPRTTASGAAKDAAATRERVVAEARHFATWTRHKKVYHDLCLRIDLLEAELVEGDARARSDFDAMRLDKDRMWQELLAQDRDAVEDQLSKRAAAPDGTLGELRGDETKARTDAGGDLEWAWWSAEELAGAAGTAKVTISLPSDAPATDDVTTKMRDPPKKLSRSKSRASASARKSDDFDVIDHDEVRSPTSRNAKNERRREEERLEIPAPSVKATKTLLSKYLEQVRAALKEAKENEVK